MRVHSAIRSTLMRTLFQSFVAVIALSFNAGADEPKPQPQSGGQLLNARGAVHSLVAAPGGEGRTALSTWIVDKGAALSTPVP